MASMKVIQFSRPPTSPVYPRPILFHPLDLGRPIPNKPSSPNDIVDVDERNQNENKIKSGHIQIDHLLYCSNKQCSGIING